MTEEATNGDASPPNAKTMSLIAREAFEIDEYVRISDILHTRSVIFRSCAYRQLVLHKIDAVLPLLLLV
jgi:hypothetical protein